MTGAIFEIIKMKNTPNKDIFEDFIEWINPGIAPEIPEEPEIPRGNLTELIKNVIERAGIDIMPEMNPLDEIIKEDEANPYRRWPGDKREPYTITLNAN